MRLKIDENLPFSLVARLGDLAHDVEHVVDEGLAGSADPDVWQAAQREERILVTQDVRFADARMFSPGAHWGIVLVRMKDPGRTALREFVAETFASRAGEDWTRCFVVIAPNKVRVRRPPSTSAPSLPDTP